MTGNKETAVSAPHREERLDKHKETSYFMFMSCNTHWGSFSYEVRNRRKKSLLQASFFYRTDMTRDNEGEYHASTYKP